MFFGERGFENQGFYFVVGNEELDVGDLPDQRVRLPVERSGLKVRAHPAAKALRLADIDDFAGTVLVEVDAGGNWYFFKFFS